MTIPEIYREWKRGCGNTMDRWPVWCWPCTWGAIRAAALRLAGRWPPPPPTLADLRIYDIDYTKPVHIPDHWITWPGKERGEPKPPIIWAEQQTESAGKCMDCKWPGDSEVYKLCPCHYTEAEWTDEMRVAYDRALKEAREAQKRGLP